MGAALEPCQRLIDDANGFAGPTLLLRVDAAPIRESTGALLSSLRLTDELIIEVADTPAGWSPLALRQRRCADSADSSMGSGPGIGGGSGPPWPQGPRFTVPQRYIRARVDRRWMLLQVAVMPEHRTMERVVQDLEDAKDAASYAHSFNAHLRRVAEGPEERTEPMDDIEAPQVKVCAPVGCRVLHSASPQLVRPGDVVMLSAFTQPEIRKFVFDGSEDFLELPQAFFHYVGWFSGGRELLLDLQGSEGETGDVLFVDPCMLRAPQPSVGGVLASMASSNGVSYAADPGAPVEDYFHTLHKTCGQVCTSFDPERKGCRARRMCGFAGVAGCGLST